MRVCLVAEGCYPYVVGGVSSWIHSLIQSFPNVEFVVLAIVANRDMRGKFAFDFPQNLTEVHEVYLEDYDWDIEINPKPLKLKKNEYEALHHLILNEEVDWDVIFQLLDNDKVSINQLLMGEDFLRAVEKCYRKNHADAVFSDYLWTMRSIYLPLFLTLKMDVPKADLYHCVATGYAGVLGAMAKAKYNCSLLVSEHGIYTREREEELIKAKWVEGIYKNIWIDQFKKMSLLAYDRADMVTSLYEYARELQMDLGCAVSKTQVTPNGISIERLDELTGKLPEDEAFINIGAVLRVAPIKDVKTMIRAFGYAKEQQPKLKLWIMGPWEEEEEYARECFELVETMQLFDVEFTGRIDVKDYLGRMDFTILTSISEGQPLTILESYAAHLPVIATDVGNCKGLIYGETDEYGQAGILTHIMNVEEIAQAMLTLANNPQMRTEMGERGYQRVTSKYKIEDMKETYTKIYSDFADDMGLDWNEQPFHLEETLQKGKKRKWRE